MFKKVNLYFHTLRYLKFKQVKYRFFYFFRSEWRKINKFKYDFFSQTPKAYIPQFSESIASPITYIGINHFKFLNLEKKFETEVDWDFTEFGKLWTYNLNYFEFLNQKDFVKENGLCLINDFTSKLPHLKNALEPYPISLRIIFWTKFFIKLNESTQKVKPEIFASIYHQGKILESSLEYHLLGNHLLENGFGLFFNAYLFHDKSFYSKAKRILNIELKEQILNDGGHFELSPMYHQIILFRLLDCINLAQNNTYFEDNFLQFLEKKAELMLSWLNQITFENGDIPLCNDASNGIAPNSKSIFDYADRLKIPKTITPLTTSGYRKFLEKNYECIIDVGNIGPDYIPGHAHSDTLSFELYVKNEPFIVDTGTSTYEKNAQRQSERSTSAHNTVQIGNIEQSEIWGGFRVARRAKARIIKETKKSVEATHDGYKKINTNHSRIFNFLESEIEIIDTISNSLNIGHAYFHFHPEVEIINLVDACASLKTIITTKGILEFENALQVEIMSFKYALEFNKLINSKKLVVKFRNKLVSKILI